MIHYYKIALHWTCHDVLMSDERILYFCGEIVQLFFCARGWYHCSSEQNIHCNHNRNLNPDPNLNPNTDMCIAFITFVRLVATNIFLASVPMPIFECCNVTSPSNFVVIICYVLSLFITFYL